MINFENFEKELNNKAKNAIIKATFDELNSGNKNPHSLMTIKKEDRELAVGCRMIGKGCVNCNGKNLTGKDIADIFIDSVKKFGKAYYPLTGDWNNFNVKHLVIFVKNGSTEYKTYARFKVEECITKDISNVPFKEYLTEPALYSLMKYKSLLLISNVETEKLPDTFLGITSAVDIRERAFKGGAPSIFML